MGRIRIIDPSRNPDMYEAARFLFECFGIDYNPETAAQLCVFLEAIKLYEERSEKYGQLWKESGATEEFFNAYRKARRLFKVFAARQPEGRLLRDSELDDALDAMNYLAFGMRNARAGRLEAVELERSGNGR